MKTIRNSYQNFCESTLQFVRISRHGGFRTNTCANLLLGGKDRLEVLGGWLLLYALPTSHFDFYVILPFRKTK